MSASPPPLSIALEDPTQPDILQLISAAEAFSASLYPAESNHHLDLDQLKKGEKVLFYVARIRGKAVGTGALALKDDKWGEIKSMFADPDVRGQGIGRKLLERLEETARERKLEVLRLETGVYNHAALEMYRKAGFVERGAFEGYQPDPLSVFMEKAVIGTNDTEAR